jgi:hypothetical protein
LLVTHSRGSTRPHRDQVAARASALAALAALVRLLRPLHAAKTVLLVPLPLVLAADRGQAELAAAGWSTLAFVLGGAAVYVGNDILDRHRDARHPVKRRRPVAAGRIPVPATWLLCLALLVPVGLLVAAGPGGRYWPLLAYLGLNVAYSRWWKHVPLVDVGAVALGLVLRVVQGAVATGTPMDTWLLVAVDRRRFDFPRLLSIVVGLVGVRRSGGVAVFVDDVAEAVDPFDLPNRADSGRRLVPVRRLRGPAESVVVVQTSTRLHQPRLPDPRRAPVS